MTKRKQRVEIGAVDQAQKKKNEGNRNAALKPGRIGRIQFTQSISGDPLLRLEAYLRKHLGSREQLKPEEIIVHARRLFDQMVANLPQQVDQSEEGER